MTTDETVFRALTNQIVEILLGHDVEMGMRLLGYAMTVVLGNCPAEVRGEMLEQWADYVLYVMEKKHAAETRDESGDRLH